MQAVKNVTPFAAAKTALHLPAGELNVGQRKREEAMEMSIWIAKLLGPVLAVLAFPMLIFPKDL